MKPVKLPILNEAEAEAMKKRLETTDLSEEDRVLIVKVIDSYMHVRSTLLKATNPRQVREWLNGIFSKQSSSLTKPE